MINRVSLRSNHWYIGSIHSSGQLGQNYFIVLIMSFRSDTSSKIKKKEKFFAKLDQVGFCRK